MRAALQSAAAFIVGIGAPTAASCSAAYRSAASLEPNSTVAPCASATGQSRPVSWNTCLMSALMRPDIVSMSTMIHHSFWFCRGETISTR